MALADIEKLADDGALFCIDVAQQAVKRRPGRHKPAWMAL